MLIELTIFKVAKFWELQGSTLKIPLVEKRALDLFTLKKYVLKEGGMELVNAEKKWTRVASEMGYNVGSNKHIGALLKVRSTKHFQTYFWCT